jgi:hypothetical protein
MPKSKTNYRCLKTKCPEEYRPMNVSTKTKLTALDTTNAQLRGLTQSTQYRYDGLKI